MTDQLVCQASSHKRGCAHYRVMSVCPHPGSGPKRIYVLWVYQLYVPRCDCCALRRRRPWVGLHLGPQRRPHVQLHTGDVCLRCLACGLNPPRRVCSVSDRCHSWCACGCIGALIWAGCGGRCRQPSALGVSRQMSLLYRLAEATF